MAAFIGDNLAHASIFMLKRYSRRGRKECQKLDARHIIN